MNLFDSYSNPDNTSYNASLKHWNKLAQDYPCLKIEEEMELLEKVRSEECKESLDFLVLSNIGEVLNVLKQVRVPSYIDPADLVGNAIPVLYEKIPLFDPSYNKPLFSFLYYPVKWSMLKTLKRQNVVSMNDNHFTEIAKYNRIIDEYLKNQGREPDDTFIAEKMGIQVETVANIRYRINVLEPASLNFEIDNELTVQDTIPCDRSERDIKRWESTRDLKYYLGFLPPQGQLVVILTAGPGIFDFDSYRLDDVGELLDLSRQRVCMIKSKSLKKLKKIARLELKNEESLKDRFRRWELLNLEKLRLKIDKAGILSKEERKEQKKNAKQGRK